MAKLFKEEQRFHEPLSKVLLVVLAIAAFYNLGSQLWSTGWNNNTKEVILGILVLTVVIIGVRQMRMRIKISRKKFRVQVRPLPWSYREIHRDEVAQICFFKMSEAALSGGWTVGVDPAIKNFNFGDNAGIVLLLKNGEEVRVFSRNLYRRSATLTEEMRELGWPVAESTDCLV